LNAGRGQRPRILRLLLAENEVPSVALSRISLQDGARVKELRELGYKITNRTERRAGQVHGFFRLEAGIRPQGAAQTTPSDPSLPLQPALFANRAPQGWKDPEEGRPRG
jgi:hypothetical protein